jgi:hypothetical protein
VKINKLSCRNTLTGTGRQLAVGVLPGSEKNASGVSKFAQYLNLKIEHGSGKQRY